MKIIYSAELDNEARILNEKEMDNKLKVDLSSADFPQQKEEEINISGKWLLIDELLEIDNKYLPFQKNEEKEITWIKLPDKYVEEDYLIHYDSEDECPLGIDVLIKEDGYPIGVVSGCDSIKQAKVDNNLDGHKYKGELGIKLNNKYFLSYKKKREEFVISKTSIDYDRGSHSI